MSLEPVKWKYLLSHIIPQKNIQLHECNKAN